MNIQHHAPLSSYTTFQLGGPCRCLVECATPIELIQTIQKFKKENEELNIYIESNENQIIYSDNGIGFDNKYKEKIFEIFERLYSKEKYEGTGIGLTICKKICEEHGWLISADGKPNEGATFTILLGGPNE